MIVRNYHCDDRRLISYARYAFFSSHMNQPFSIAIALAFNYDRYIHCFSDKAEMLFPNAHPQNPVNMAAGDHPQEMCDQ